MKKLLLCIAVFLSLKVYSQTQPNFIFITIDDLNDWVQGFSGHPQAATPNIQFLEKKGTTFTNAYAASPQCAPSRVSLITGKDCTYTQVYHNNTIKCGNFRMNFNEDKGNETVFTIPEILKDSAGYFTYSISKVMHCHEKFPDYDSLTADMCSKELSWNKAIIFDETHGEEQEVEEWGYANELGVFEFAYSMIPDSLETKMQDYIATDSAIAFIENYAADPSGYCDKPFFLALGFRRPHSPCYIPEKYFLSYHNTNYYQIPYNLPYNDPIDTFPYNGVVMPPQPVPVWNDYYNLPFNGVAQSLVKESPAHFSVFNWADWIEGGYGIPYIADGLTEEERDYALEESKRANMIMGYLAAIKFVDAQIGRLIDEMKTHPEIYNNTVFVVMSDHGYSLGEKQHWKKGALWETDIRVPLVITDMRAPAKKTCKRFVNLIDLFPTICDLANTDYPAFPDGSPYLDGFSLEPLLTNPSTPWDRPILSSFLNGKDTTEQGACFVHYSVRDDEWHYIKYSTNGDLYPVECDSATSEVQEELYRIGKKKNIDPNEWNNLSSNPAYNSTKSHLASFMPGGVNYLQFDRTASIEENTLHEISFTIYPNPASNYAVFTIQDAAIGNAHINISDLSGRKFFSDVISVEDNYTTGFTFNLQHLEPGIYFATFIQDEIEINTKFIVIR